MHPRQLTFILKSLPSILVMLVASLMLYSAPESELDAYAPMSSETYITESICEGVTYAFGSMELSISGNYMQTFAAQDGQDSTVYLTLLVYPTYVQTYDAVLCFGQSIVINGNVYSQAGTYADTLSSAFGCDSIIVINLTVENQLAPKIIAVSDSFCTGSSLTLDAGLAYDAYFWSTGETTQQISVSTAGTYTVTVTQGQCSASASRNITAITCSPLDAGFTINDSIGCAPHVVSLEWTSPGTGASVNWDFGNGIFSNQNDPVIIYGVPGFYTIILTVSDGLQTSTDSIEVEILNSPVVTLSASVQDTCLPTQVQFDYTLTGDNAAIGWQWAFGDGVTSTDEFPLHTYSNFGTYLTALTIIDEAGCETLVLSDTEVLNNGTVPPPTLIQITICAGETFNDFQPTQDTSIQTVFFIPGQCDSLVITEITVNPILNFELDTTICEGNLLIFGNQVFGQAGIYEFTQTNVYSCQDQYALTLNTLGQLESNLPVTICLGDTFEINGNFYHAGNPSGTEVFTSSGGCDSLVHVALTFESQPLQLLSSGSPDTAVCSINPLSLNAGSGGLSYQWSTGATQQIISVTQTGTYAVTVTNTAGCPAVGSVFVIVQTPPAYVPDAGNNVVVCGRTAQLQAAALPANITGFWSGPEGVIIQSPFNPATTVIDLPDGESTFTWTVSVSVGVCQQFDSDNMTVTAFVREDDTALANAGEDLLFCELQSSVQLQASSDFHTPDQGTWSILQGPAGLTIVNPNSPVTQLQNITQEGNISLEWRLSNNACGIYSRDTVHILLGTAHLPVADGGGPYLSCGEDTVRLPLQKISGAIGAWQVIQGTGSVSADENEAVLTGITAGEMLLSWTLSTDLCPSFSADTVEVILPAGPLQANYLQYFVPDEGNVEGIDPLSNDQIPDYPGNMVLTIAQEPELGQLLHQGNNIFTYIPPPGLDVTVSFIYLVCNDLCENWCTQATVALTPFSILPSRVDPPIAPPRNVITPNGDGIGDAMEIPNFNDIAGNIKLTIVNRWGDVVFQQYPYDNNWQGTTSNGQDLPEGTYYFLLELASGGQEAVELGGARTGSVTILR